MNASDMIELRSRLPFVPFRIHLRDGTSIHIQEPNQIATGRNSPECVIYESDEHFRFVRYRDVAEVVTATVNGA